MKQLKTCKSILMAALLVALANCGSSGSDDQFEFTNLFEGLYVVSSTPAHNQYYVPTTTHTITIRMSENINPASLENQLQVVTDAPVDSDTCGGNVVTNNFTVTASGSIITLTTTSDLANNENYQVQLFPGITSEAGNTLLQGQSFSCFYIDISTGNAGTAGNSVPGAPTVSSYQKSPIGGCFSAIVKFNEALATQPLMHTEHHGPDTFFSWVSTPVYAQPVFAGDMTQWRVTACHVPTLSDVEIHVDEYVDFDEGNHGAQDQSQTWYWAGY